VPDKINEINKYMNKQNDVEANYTQLNDQNENKDIEQTSYHCTGVYL